MKGYTFYTKDTGVEIAGTTVKKEKNGAVRKEGRVMLRFFGFGEKSQDSIRFIMNPPEAYGVSLKILEVVKTGERQSFTHKFKGENGETISTLTLEKWEREREKEVKENGVKKTVKVKVTGYAMRINREESNINVSMDAAAFLFAGELLRSLSTAVLEESETPAAEPVHEEHAETPATEVPAAEVPAKASAAVEQAKPAQKPAADNGNGGSAKTSPPVNKSASVKGNGNGNGKLYGAVIDTVSEDGKTINVGSLQLKVTDKTKNEIGALTAGIRVNIYYGKGYAYGIYPIKQK